MISVTAVCWSLQSSPGPQPGMPWTAVDWRTVIPVVDQEAEPGQLKEQVSSWEKGKGTRVTGARCCCAFVRGIYVPLAFSHLGFYPHLTACQVRGDFYPHSTEDRKEVPEGLKLT